jgi:hypothetical protein
MLRLTAATTRTAAAWTDSGTSHDERGLKHRPDGAIRMVQVSPVLVTVLRAHVTTYGIAPDGRLFRGTRGGPLSGSVYSRAWHRARVLSLGPELAASGLARRPLRPAARRLVHVAECRRGPSPDRGPGREQRRGPAHRLYPLHPRSRRPAQPANRALPWTAGGTWSVPVRQKASGLHRPRDYTEASGYTDRDGHGRRPLRVRHFPARPADGPQITPVTGHQRSPSIKRLADSKPHSTFASRHLAWPTAGPQTVREPLAPARKSR